jgi:hypothetical protein
MTVKDRPPKISTILVVVATFVAVLATMTTWVRSQLLDTEEWVRTSEALLADDEVQEALGNYLATQLFENVDLESELEQRLPGELSRLAGPLAGSLRSPVENGIDRLVTSDQFAGLWTTANDRAHETLVAILRDETRENVSTADGTVSIDLRSLVVNVGTEAGFPEAALERIPDDAGTVVIFESDELATAQTAVSIFDFLSWFLFLVVVALYVLAVYLARGHRNVMVRRVGVGLVVGSVVILLLRTIALRVFVNTAVADVQNEPLAEAIGSVATALMREIAWTGVVYGVGIIAVSWLVGPNSWARRVRSVIGPLLQSWVAVIVVAIIVFLVLLWWSPGRSFQSWWSVLVLLGVTVSTVVAVRSLASADQPDEQSGEQSVEQSGEPAVEPPGVDPAGPSAGASVDESADEPAESV